jgi:chitinase
MRVLLNLLLPFILITVIGNILNAQSEFKRIGYIPFYKVKMVKSLDFEGLTHLNIAFANPDEYGNLHTKTYDYAPIVEKAHKHNVEVYISLAGGGLAKDLSEQWETLMNPSNRSWYISKIKDYVLINGLQGADMDLEWGDVNKYYSAFVQEMKDTFDIYELGLTAALPAVKRFSPITDEALDAFDWINMMVYDARGPWNPDNPGQHSSVDFALQAIEFWRGQGVSADRLVLGVPFYGYDFSDRKKIHSVHYSELIEQSATNAFLDQKGLVFYNGIHTILKKLRIAYSELGGIMMWELGQDAPDAFSLWGNIKRELSLYESQKKRVPVSVKTDLYPNPFEKEFVLELKKQTSGYARIKTVSGKVLYETDFTDKKMLNINPLNIPNGIFVMEIIDEKTTYKYKLVKQTN